MNEQKQIELMQWQNGKLTVNELTEKQKKAFCELYKTKSIFEEVLHGNKKGD